MRQSKRANIIILVLLVTFIFFIKPSLHAIAGTATLSWDANIEADLAAYKVYFGTSTGSYGAPINVGNVTNYSLSGLSDGSYFFAVTAIDTSGNESGYSNEVSKSISTTTDTTPPVLSNITAGGLTGNAAVISWLSDEAADSQVEYGLTTAYGTSTSLQIALTTGHSQSLSALLSSTLYHYRVRSRDAAGNLQTSVDKTLTTLSTPDTVAPSISNISAGNISTSGARISWITDEASDAQVEYGLTTPYNQTSLLNTTLGTSHGIDVSGLNANTTYHYRVLSRDAAGNLAPSLDQSFQTLAVPDSSPPIISGVTHSGLTGTTAIVTWNTNEGASSQVDFGLTTSYGLSTTNSTNLVNSHSRTLTGLSAATTYHYRVRSSDGSGNEGLSTDRSFTTPVNSGLMLTNLSVASGLSYEVVNGGLADGAVVYIDRTYTFNGFPAHLNAAIYIKTANNDKASTGNTFLSFNLTADGSVYIAHDDRISAKPAWLLSVFSDTGQDIVIAGNPHSLFKGTFPAGPVSLGGNQGGGQSMYVVIVTGSSVGPIDSTAPVLTGINAGLITETGATITWQSNEASTSQIEFGSDNTYGSTTAISSNLVTSHSQGLTGLSPSKIYHFRVISSDAFSNKTTSVDFSFTTQNPPSVPGPSILLVTSSELSDRSAKITWGSDRPGTTQVSFGKTTAYGMSSTINLSLSLSHSQILSGLTPETTYHYQVITADASGNRSFSGDHVFTTAAALNPSPVDTLSPVTVVHFSASPGFRKLTLNWTNPSTPNFQGVRIYYATNGPIESIENASVLGDFVGAPGEEMTTIHAGLENNQSYFYAAVPYDVGGNFKNIVRTSAKTLSPDSKSNTGESSSSSGGGGCGMIKPGDGGDPPGPGQAAEMIGMLGIIFLLLFKKMTRAVQLQIVKM